MKQRILTGIIGAAVFFFFLWWGGMPFSLFIALLSIVAFCELLIMKGIRPISFPSILGFLFLIGNVLSGHVLYLRPFDFGTSVYGYGFVLATWSVITKNRFTFLDAAFCIFSFAYIGYGFQHALAIRLGTNGILLFLLFLLVIWATDTGAYFIGRKLGGRKLWPEISPNKTISGSLGGIAAAVIVSVIYVPIVLRSLSIPIVSIIIFACMVSAIGQLGDLVESAVKRHFGVKDSGRILPGHGGAFDRFDSFIYAAPFAFWFIHHFWV